MSKTIQYYSKEVYGQTLFYLANSSDRTLWRDLTGKKTITKSDIGALSMLTDVTFERVFEAVS